MGPPSLIPHLQTKSMFERGATDEFMVTSLVKLGEISSACVWLENVGMADAWHLDKVVLMHLPSQRWVSGWGSQGGGGGRLGCSTAYRQPHLNMSLAVGRH
jgi:hypothetical protein